MSKNILALDLSTKSSGWATKVDEKLEYGCITSSSSKVEKRITVMKDEIISLIKNYNIDIIVCEDVRPDIQNTHTQKILNWLQGVIAVSAYNENPKIEIEYILPNSWRSKIGIKTGAGVKRETLKQKDIEYVKIKYSIDVNDDIADAIGIYDSYTNPITKKNKDLSEFGDFFA